MVQKELTPAEKKQREDSKELLSIAIADREDMVKRFTLLENNLRTFVERSNYELAAMARVIQQKDENIATLKKMVGGYFVEPTAPVIARDGKEPPPEISKETPKEPIKENGASNTPAKAASDAETVS
jgi:hypothetical protein